MINERSGKNTPLSSMYVNVCKVIRVQFEIICYCGLH